MSSPVDSSTELRAQQVNARSAPPLTSSSSTSPLLALPGEIRNLIYKYALTTEHGISLLPGNCDRPPQFSARAPNEWTPPTKADLIKGGFNQLKLTCRQVYHETAGTEVKFNKVYVFGELGTPGPAQLFGEFLVGCASEKAAWFQDVALCHDDDDEGVWMEHKAHMTPIAMLCRNQPHTNVRYMLRALDIRYVGLGWLVKVGLYLELAFREKDLRSSVTNASELDSLVDEMEDAAQSEWFSDPERLTLGSLPNFRFWPFDTSALPTHIDDAELKTQISPWNDVLDEEFCIPLFKRWTDEGI